MIDASRWLRHIVVGVVVVGFAGLLGFLALAWRPAIAPIQPPARDSFPAALVAKGKILAGAGYCAVCHTRAGGQEFVDGYGLRTPFGTIYSTNITPDLDTGIGRLSEAAFARAIHQAPTADAVLAPQIEVSEADKEIQINGRASWN